MFLDNISDHGLHAQFWLTLPIYSSRDENHMKERILGLVRDCAPSTNTVVPVM